MEASKRIYIVNDDVNIKREWYKTKQVGFETTEYTRTDAFIDKAAIWFNNNFMVQDEYGVISDSFNTKEEMFEDFKNYMKEE